MVGKSHRNIVIISYVKYLPIYLACLLRWIPLLEKDDTVLCKSLRLRQNPLPSLKSKQAVFQFEDQSLLVSWLLNRILSDSCVAKYVRNSNISRCWVCHQMLLENLNTSNSYYPYVESKRTTVYLRWSWTSSRKRQLWSWKGRRLCHWLITLHLRIRIIHSAIRVIGYFSTIRLEDAPKYDPRLKFVIHRFLTRYARMSLRQLVDLIENASWWSHRELIGRTRRDVKCWSTNDQNEILDTFPVSSRFVPDGCFIWFRPNRERIGMPWKCWIHQWPKWNSRYVPSVFSIRSRWLFHLIENASGTNREALTWRKMPPIHKPLPNVPVFSHRAFECTHSGGWHFGIRNVHRITQDWANLTIDWDYAKSAH
jgi:hypothetical protein